MKRSVGGVIVALFLLFFLYVPVTRAIDNFPAGSYLLSLEDTIFSETIARLSSRRTANYIERKVARNIRFWMTRGRRSFQKWLNSSAKYLPLMKKILKEEGLPEDLALLPLIESGFNVHARSSRRAVGLWQFVPSTARHYGLRVNRWIDERKDPVKSTRAAARYIKDLYRTFGTWPLALASYNAGKGKVRRALIRSRASSFWGLRYSRYLKRETKNYVPRFMAALVIMKNPERFGFVMPDPRPFSYDEVAVPGGMDLRNIADIAKISYRALRRLNPQLKTHLTPPDRKTYILRFPPGTGKRFVKNFRRLPSRANLVYREYKIKKGDTVYDIARKYRVSMKAIRRVNRLNRRYTIVAGRTLFIPVAMASPEQVRLISTASPEISKNL